MAARAPKAKRAKAGKSAAQPSAGLESKRLLGRLLFNQSCRECHVPPRNNSPKFGVIDKPYAPLLTKGTLSGDEEVLAETIANGSPRMPGFKDHFKPAEIQALVAYLKTLPDPAAPAPAIHGKVKSAAGERLNGVMVSVKPVGGTITTTVLTDSEGAYYFPPLAAGRYTIWAKTLGYETTKLQTTVVESAEVDLTLRPVASAEALFRQLPGHLMLKALPEKTAADRRLKRLVRANCTGCHTASYPLQHRFDRAGWNAILTLMKNVETHGAFIGDKRKPYGILDFYQERLADYLGRVRDPANGAPTVKLDPRPSGEAARVVFTEYDLPLDLDAKLPPDFVQNDGSDWSLGTPSVSIPGWGVHDAWMDRAGDIWFTGAIRNKRSSIGRVEARTGDVTVFKIPGEGDSVGLTHGMTRDPSGMIWFNVNPPGALGRLNPETEEIKVFAPPKAVGPIGGLVTLDYDGLGRIWASAADGAVMFDPKTERFSYYKSRTFETPTGPGVTYGVAGDRDGNGHWAQMAIDTIGTATPASGEVSELKLAPIAKEMEALSQEEREFFDGPYEADYNTAPPWAQGPRRMGADKNGDVVWIADSWGGNLARVDTKTRKTTYVPLPGDQQPYHVAVDKDHNVWTNLWVSDRVMRLNPQTNEWTTFDLPTRGAETRYISLAERDGQQQVVLPYFRARKIAVMTLRSDDELNRLKARAEGSLNMWCGNSLREALAEIVPQFARATGHKVNISYEPITAIAERVRKGQEPIDLACLSVKNVEALIKDGKIESESQSVFAETGLGLFTKKGGAKPDISGVDEFKSALIGSSSVAMPGPVSPVAEFVLPLMGKLGIDAQMKEKLVLDKSGDNSCRQVASGQVQFGIWQLTFGCPGIEAVAPFPAEVDNKTVFVAAVPSSSGQRATAEAFRKFLSTPKARAILKSKRWSIPKPRRPGAEKNP